MDGCTLRGKWAPAPEGEDARDEEALRVHQACERRAAQPPSPEEAEAAVRAFNTFQLVASPPRALREGWGVGACMHRARNLVCMRRAELPPTPGDAEPQVFFSGGK